MSELRTPVIANPENQRLSNRFGLTMSNGTVTMSVPALELLLNAAREEGPASSYQARVNDWMLECFGADIAADPVERSFRFLEEALELVQANGCTAEEAHRLVDYTYGRPVGEIRQEVGGVSVCLAALCTAAKVDLVEAAEAELARVWTKVEKIRAKHASKPAGVRSSLPGAAPTSEGGA